MSKESKRRQQYISKAYPESEAVSPVVPYEDLDAVGKATFVVNEAEWKYLSNYEKAASALTALGLTHAAAIADGEKLEELDRLNPQGRWSVENGDKPKPKNKDVDWGNL